MSKPLTLALALASLSLLPLSACTDVDSGDNAEIDTPRDRPPTDLEQREEMAIRARMVAGIDPTRWEGFYADGTARFATPSGVVDESAVEPTTQMARGDGVLVLADGRKFRQRH